MNQKYQHNQDNDADIFDPFLTLVKSSKYFDQEDVACVEQTRKEHQKHVNTRIDMDRALVDTKQFLTNRMQELQQFEQTVPDKTRSSPAYKHFFETFLQKQVMIQNKYNELREKREAIYGTYATPPASPHQLSSVPTWSPTDMPEESASPPAGPSSSSSSSSSSSAKSEHSNSLAMSPTLPPSLSDMASGT